MIRGGAVIIEVRDVAHAVRFYIETLGMKLVRDESEPVIDCGEGFLIELRQGDARVSAAPPAIVLYPKVPLDEAIAILENRGVIITVERSESTVIARFDDPDGNRLALVQRN